MSLRSEENADRRYADEEPAQRYADHGTRDNDRLFEYRYERQRLGAQKIAMTNGGAAPGEALARDRQSSSPPEPASAPGVAERGSALADLYGTQGDVSSLPVRGERAPRAGGAPLQSRPEGPQPPLSVAEHSAAASVGVVAEPTSKAAEVRATCVSCLSANTMSCTAEGIFCSTCNRAALVPRLAAQAPL